MVRRGFEPAGQEQRQAAGKTGFDDMYPTDHEQVERKPVAEQLADGKTKPCGDQVDDQITLAAALPQVEQRGKGGGEQY